MVRCAQVEEDGECAQVVEDGKVCTGGGGW